MIEEAADLGAHHRVYATEKFARGRSGFAYAAAKCVKIMTRSYVGVTIRNLTLQWTKLITAHVPRAAPGRGSPSGATALPSQRFLNVEIMFNDKTTRDANAEKNDPFVEVFRQFIDMKKARLAAKLELAKAPGGGAGFGAAVPRADGALLAAMLAAMRGGSNEGAVARDAAHESAAPARDTAHTASRASCAMPCTCCRERYRCCARSGSTDCRDWASCSRQCAGCARRRRRRRAGCARRRRRRRRAGCARRRRRRRRAGCARRRRRRAGCARRRRGVCRAAHGAGEAEARQGRVVLVVAER